MKIFLTISFLIIWVAPLQSFATGLKKKSLKYYLIGAITNLKRYKAFAGVYFENKDGQWRVVNQVENLLPVNVSIFNVWHKVGNLPVSSRNKLVFRQNSLVSTIQGNVSLNDKWYIDRSKKLHSGWAGTDSNIVLVLSNLLSLNDVSEWTKVKASPTVFEQVFLEFTKKNPVYKKCKKDTVQVVESVPWKRINLAIARSFVSKNKDYIVVVNPYDHYKLTNCDGVYPEEFSQHWYFIRSKDGHTTVKLVGRGLQPVMTADFADLNYSQWLFRFSSYNEDGYLLFDPASLQSLKFAWKYH